jgi:Fur family zinc uptake transcriptional regulator
MARSLRSETRRRSPGENDELVYSALQKTAKPITAYELLDRLRDKGVTAPPTVYRSLDRLIEEGKAHKLESLNAFVACAHPHHRTAAIFAICRNCGAASEFSDTSLVRRIVSWAKRVRFDVEEAIVEMRGLCGECKSALTAERS